MKVCRPYYQILELTQNVNYLRVGPSFIRRNAKATLTGNGFPWLYAQGTEAKTTVGSSVTSAGSSFAGRVQKTRSESGRTMEVSYWHPLPCRIMGNELIIACSFYASQESVDTPDAKLALPGCQDMFVFCT